MKALCLESVPKETPKVPAALGVSWNPQAQLGAYQLRGPNIIIGIFDTSQIILPANPNRMAWFAQCDRSASPIQFWAGDVIPIYTDYTALTQLPYRCTAVDYPGLCQQQWSARWEDGSGLYVWELVSNT